MALSGWNNDVDFVDFQFIRVQFQVGKIHPQNALIFLQHVLLDFLLHVSGQFPHPFGGGQQQDKAAACIHDARHGMILSNYQCAAMDRAREIRKLRKAAA